MTDHGLRVVDRDTRRPQPTRPQSAPRGTLCVGSGPHLAGRWEERRGDVGICVACWERGWRLWPQREGE